MSVGEKTWLITNTYRKKLMLDYTRDILPYLTLGADGLPVAKLRHVFYQASIDHREHLRRVFRKAYPAYLDINRPKEQSVNKLYRRKVYKNPFRGLRTRIIETLDYVRQADDFAVVFPDDKTRPGQTQTDTLETYTGAGFSGDGPLVDWFFKRVRPMYVKDPNAVLVVLPLDQPGSVTERVEPRALLIDCDRVFQHKRGRFCVAESPERAWVTDPLTGIRSQTGRVFLFLDEDSYAVAICTAQGVDASTRQTLWQWEVTGLAQAVDEQGNPVDGFVFRPPLHGCPVMPAVKIGKQQQDEAEDENDKTAKSKLTKATDQGEEYYESLLSDALPFIERAQQIENDIAVELNFHVSSQEWRYMTKKCPSARLQPSDPKFCANGSVVLRDGDGLVVGLGKCPACGGSGMDATGSGTDIIGVTPPEATNFDNETRPANLPIPPGGFIPRSIEPLREFVLEYKRNSDEAYATINMQFLKATPTDQSGTSKRYDREELYRELNTQGAHLCGLLRLAFIWAAWQRYQNEQQVPAVIEPVRFNLENAEITRQELTEAVKNGFDPGLRAPLEKKLIAYQTGENSDYYRRFELKERIDPYQNWSKEDKQFLLATQRIVLQAGTPELQLAAEEIWLSIYLDGLITEQLRKNDGFWNLTPQQQYERLMAATRQRVGKITGPPLDPTTGKPQVGGTTLQPIVDLKNNHQLS